MEADRLKNDILTVDKHNFNELALEIFHLQVKTNPVYSKFVQELGINSGSISQISQIPYLPISFFKTQKVVSNHHQLGQAEICFESSSTTGQGTAKHWLFDSQHYLNVASKNFESQYGDLKNYCILALLPGYLDRKNSSLVYMVKHFIERSKFAESDFYLDDFEGLHSQLISKQKKKVPTLLFGVSFALLDFAEKYPVHFPDLIVMDTGGMKGRRKEIIRAELQDILKAGFGVPSIHSEYGMTELLSQAYAKADGRFRAPPWMRISIRETSDPFQEMGVGRTGGINIIDLANIDSCSFIASSDLGKLHEDGSFEVLGRFDHSDIRGCNLMYS